MLETCVDPNLEPASGLDWDKMQIYQTHVKSFFDNLHGVLVQEGWASLAGEFEDSEGHGIGTRAQMSLLWSYRGKVDWKTFELPFTGIEPAVFLMSGVLKCIDLTAQTSIEARRRIPIFPKASSVSRASTFMVDTRSTSGLTGFHITNAPLPLRNLEQS